MRSRGGLSGSFVVLTCRLCKLAGTEKACHLPVAALSYSDYWTDRGCCAYVEAVQCASRRVYFSNIWSARCICALSAISI